MLTLNALRRNWKPILLLMLVSPLLAEVFSGSMPASDYFQPGIFLPFTIFVYGLPILVLRELAAHRRVGLLGLWGLGIIYGLFNEGLISETLYHPLDPANPAYDSYGLVAGLRIPWTLFILPWHGVFSLVTPVVLIDLLFPGQAGRPWLPKKATWALAIVTGGLAVARFVLWGENRTVQESGVFALQAAIVLGIGVLAYLLADRLPRPSYITSDRRPALWKPFAAGAALYAAWFVGTELLVSIVRPPWPIAALYTVAAVTVGLWLISRRHEIRPTTAAAFVLGIGTAQAAVTVLLNGLLVADTFRAVSGAIFIAVYLIALSKVGAQRRTADHLE
ncbi:hypothetical protein C1I98_00120 [Spongiactinospora gelatinilytica]|uniref:Uncharacterized protein n=1 Tax=Spongiactinospora gelatinilytica TaxID=2666298 RepID=A0A2W2H991_9ACTN|nr:hypothetical protein [Spongiactinospora gelatinilytica]PZG57112.1 hypothetical protein C1I98_00120 [Spongiactinospora gelatinilytica]